MINLGPRLVERLLFSRWTSSLYAALAAAFLLTQYAQSQSSDPIQVTSRSIAEASVSDLPPIADDGSRLMARAKPLVMNVDLVLVPVSVTDAQNHLVVGLEGPNFELYENDQPQPLRYFASEDVPLSLGVILDISKSMRNKIDVAREAVAEFFKTANPQDDFFVVTFCDRPRLLVDFTDSIGSIQGKLTSAVPGGHTALLDAIYLGVAKSRAARHRRRALLIISDGGDNRSRYKAKEIRKLVQEEDVEIYAIGIFDSIFQTLEERAGKRLLTRISEATGGRTIALSNPRQLPGIAAAISFELRNQYVLGYQPTQGVRDGKWRKIKVRLIPPAGSATLQVYSKNGYFAPAE
jgi:Ca-activated chloride channel family protein